MFTHAPSGAASFAAALRLFRLYPLAVSPWSAGGGPRSLLLRYGGGFFLLSEDRGGYFRLRPWQAGDWAYGDDGDYTGAGQEIGPAEPATAAVHAVLTEGMPVPRDGALLGWVCDRQAAVLLSVVHGTPGAGGLAEPQIRVLPMVGSGPAQWPPFTARPLDDGCLWQYVERGELVDLAPVFAREPGSAFWVPSQNSSRATASHGCIVIARPLPDDEFWLPAGVYMDHWMLREGVPAPPASHLLGLPGTVDLSRRLTLTPAR